MNSVADGGGDCVTRHSLNQPVVVSQSKHEKQAKDGAQAPASHFAWFAFFATT
jgi:hypothetical protein